MKSGWMTRRHRGERRTGLTGAILAVGLATTVLTTSGLDGGDDPGSKTSDAVEAVLTDPSTGSPLAIADEAASAARPVLRVGDTGAPSKAPPQANEPTTSAPPGTGTGRATDGSATSPPSTTATPAPNGGASSDRATRPHSTTGATPATEPPSTTAPSTATSPTVTPSSAAAPTAQPTGSGARFVTLGPGAALPSGARCAALVRSTPENVPENQTRNRTRGAPVRGTYLSDNPSIGANDYESRIDGDFVGSTDEIIQWAACKWGFDEDLLRAQIYAESSWYAGKLGDCGESTVPETGGCASVGLIQVRSAERGATHHPGVYPGAWRSSALNLDYGLAVQRLCYEGLESWLGQSGAYRAGDQWNCMGRWFSGSWADAGSMDYQAKVRDILARRPWETWVGCPAWQTNNHCAN